MREGRGRGPHTPACGPLMYCQQWKEIDFRYMKWRRHNVSFCLTYWRKEALSGMTGTPFSAEVSLQELEIKVGVFKEKDCTPLFTLQRGCKYMKCKDKRNSK